MFEIHTFDASRSYEDIYRWQKALVEKRIQGEIPDTLLLGEHPHVITLGRGSRQANQGDIPSNIPIVEIERGGDITYHGPGQLIGYPIIHLAPGERDLHGYLRRLEEVLIQVLKGFGIIGQRKSGYTGVWVGDFKIASIGLAVRKWTTYHGFALNVSTDLAYYHSMNPCGLPSNVMTSMQACLPNEIIELSAVQTIVECKMRALFCADIHKPTESIHLP